MPLPRSGTRLAIELLGTSATPWLRLAERVDAVEQAYIRKAQKAISTSLPDIVWAIAQGSDPDQFAPDLEGLFVELWFEVMRQELPGEPKARPSAAQALLARPKGPQTLKDLQKLYDAWRKGLWKPKRAASQGNKIREAYLGELQKWWKRRADDFLQGRTFNQNEVVAAARREVRRPLAEARTVVRTETTSYQNQSRRDRFDRLPGITHYLFLSIRDQRTTKWCQTRHGMVLEKNTKLLEENSPAVHWNCRSEIVPLDPDNPKHAQMIEDKSRRASNRKLEPLPKEFRRS